MADLPTQTNQTATKIDAGIKVVNNVLVQVALNLIEADVPVLKLPVIKQVFETLVGWLYGYFVKAQEQFATDTVIDIQVGKEKSALSLALAALIVAEQSKDPEKIKEAIQAYANANSALLHDDGSAPAQ